MVPFVETGRLEDVVQLSDSVERRLPIVALGANRVDVRDVRLLDHPRSLLLLIHSKESLGWSDRLVYRLCMPRSCRMERSSSSIRLKTGPRSNWRTEGGLSRSSMILKPTHTFLFQSIPMPSAQEDRFSRMAEWSRSAAMVPSQT